MFVLLCLEWLQHNLGLLGWGHFVYASGIWAGMKTVRYFDGRTYDWVGLSRQPNIISKVCLSNVQANGLCCKALSDAGNFPLLPFVLFWFMFLFEGTYLLPNCTWRLSYFSLMNHDKVISLGHVGCAGKLGQRPFTFSQLKCPLACLNLFFLSIVSVFFSTTNFLRCISEGISFWILIVAFSLSLFNLAFFVSLGQKDTGPVHTSTVGQRWVVPSTGSLEIHPSAEPLYCFHGCRTEYILSQVLPLDPSTEPLDCLPSGTLVVDCYTNNPRVQYLLARQV
jgi:hypothetical protein